MKDNEKYLVEFAGEGMVRVEEGQSILDASLKWGIPHFHVCGGEAKCSTCRILVIDGDEYLTPPTQKESFLKNQMHFPPNVRLACQTHVTGNKVTVRRIIQDETDIGLYVGSAAGDSTQQLGEEKELALMFLDIRNFTEFVGSHPAFDVIHIIRKLFSSFQCSIETNNGKIVETTGDGLYAVFGYQKKKLQSSQTAVQAAYSILADLETLNHDYFMPHFQTRIQVGIGVHVGKVVSGVVRVGKEDHPVVMGFPANIASRLQNATKELNNNFIISAEVYNSLIDPPAFQPKAIVVKGISTPLTIYLMGQPYKPKDEIIQKEKATNTSGNLKNK